MSAMICSDRRNHCLSMVEAIQLQACGQTVHFTLSRVADIGAIPIAEMERSFSTSHVAGHTTGARMSHLLHCDMWASTSGVVGAVIY